MSTKTMTNINHGTGVVIMGNEPEEQMKDLVIRTSRKNDSLIEKNRKLQADIDELLETDEAKLKAEISQLREDIAKHIEHEVQLQRRADSAGATEEENMLLRVRLENAEVAAIGKNQVLIGIGIRAHSNANKCPACNLNSSDAKYGQCDAGEKFARVVVTAKTLRMEITEPQTLLQERLCEVIDALFDA